MPRDVEPAGPDPRGGSPDPDLEIPDEGDEERWLLRQFPLNQESFVA